jgi:hypothetical protein
VLPGEVQGLEHAGERRERRENGNHEHC